MLPELRLPVGMDWRHVLFANWPVEPSILDAHLPSTLDVDTFDGRGWLSVVPFVNAAVRPKGVPRSLGFTLPELNLRTYVTHDGTPGVYFFSLDAEGRLGVIAARLFHHLPYYDAAIETSVANGRVEFQSRRRHPGARPCDFHASYEPTGDEFLADSDSLAWFLTERYRYFTETPGGDLRDARIRHEQWPLREAKLCIDTNEVFEANGFATPEDDPHLLYSPGVDVVASGSRSV
jgi:uncharacterized protein YqjF (DUF2071 family)